MHSECQREADSSARCYELRLIVMEREALAIKLTRRVSPLVNKTNTSLTGRGMSYTFPLAVEKNKVNAVGMIKGNYRIRKFLHIELF
jgi:hypothetical protein